MGDERVGKLARVLVDYSIEAGEGDQVLVFGEVGAEPLVTALYARLLQVGAFPVLQVGLPGMQELFFEQARDIHYGEIPSIRRFIGEEADAEIGIRAPSNTRALANVDPRKAAGARRTEQAALGDHAGEGPLGADALPDGGAGPGGRHGPRRVRGVRVRGHGPERGGPRPLLGGEVAGARTAEGEAGGGARDPHRRARDGPDALGRGTDVYQLGGQAQHAVRRGVHRPHRGLGQRDGLFRRTGGDRGARGLRCQAPLRGGQGRRGERGAGRGVPDEPARRRPGGTVPRRDRASGPTTASGGRAPTSSSTRSSAGRSTSPSAAPTRRPAARTSRACTRTSSATCATAENSTRTGS